MAKQAPPLEFKLKYETAASLQNALTSEYHHRKQAEADGHPTQIKQWEETIRPIYEYLSQYVEKYQ